MDERKLEELFQNAVPAAPEASFDRQDVLRGSRRATARRRVAASGGAFVLAAVLLGGVGVGTGWFGPEQPGQPVAGEDQHRSEQPPEPRSGDANEPGVLMQPRSGNGEQCGPPDERLVRDVHELLPQAARGAPESASAARCGPDVVAATFPVRDGAVDGELTVIVRSEAHPEEGDAQRPNGGPQVVREADSGRTVIVSSTADPESAAPYGARLPTLADQLAARY